MTRSLLNHQQMAYKISVLKPNFLGETPLEELNRTIHLIFKLSQAIDVTPLDILNYILQEIKDRSIQKI